MESKSAVNGATKILGLLGQGIDHSLSPLIHNRSIEHLGCNYIYVPFQVPTDKLADFLDVMWAVGAKGFNITMPLKEVVAKHLNLKLRSVNTIYRDHSFWGGASTDASGFVRALERLGRMFPTFKKLVILGNGGVVTAILEHIGRHPDLSPDIIILRRSSGRDGFLRKLLPRELKLTFASFEPGELSLQLDGMGKETLLVQASSAPLKGDALDRFAPALDKFSGSVVELTYGCRSAIFDKARVLGLPAQDGIPMLIEQARLAQRYWWGHEAPFDVIERHLRPEKDVVLEP